MMCPGPLVVSKVGPTGTWVSLTGRSPNAAHQEFDCTTNQIVDFLHEKPCVLAGWPRFGFDVLLSRERDPPFCHNPAGRVTRGDGPKVRGPR